MIDSIFAGEFDLQKGCVIKSHYPKIYDFDEIVLAAYMIPDGVQKTSLDISIFKYKLKQQISKCLHEQIVKINTLAQSTLINLYKFDHQTQSWVERQQFSNLKISQDGKTIIFESIDENNIQENGGFYTFQIHKDIQYKQLKEDFYCFYTINQGESYGINFCEKDQQLKEILVQFFDEKTLFSQNQPQITLEQEFLFYTVIRNKKDQNFKRGLLTRSLGICSSQNQILYYFEPALKHFIDIYIQFPIEEDILPTERLLEEAFNQINQNMQIPLGYLKVSNQRIIEEMQLLKRVQVEAEENIQIKISDEFQYEIKVNKSVYRNYSGSSTINLIKHFGQKIMHIWNAMLKEQKIIFIGYEKSIRESINLICALQSIIFPLNINDKMLPYSNLIDLTFLDKKTFITSVSNPLFEQKDSWWDLCCNISDGNIKNNENINEKLMDAKMAHLDKEFIKEILNRIKENNITEQEVIQLFATYTKVSLNFLINNANLIDNVKEDKNLIASLQRRSQQFSKTSFIQQIQDYENQQRLRFKLLFGEMNYVQIFESLLIVKDSRILNDLEIITLYNCIINNVKNEKQLEYVLKFILSKKSQFDCLGIGIFSKTDAVVKKNIEMIIHLEQFQLGKKFIKEFSFMFMYSFENLKKKFF